jgi:hypothetical protein
MLRTAGPRAQNGTGLIPGLANRERQLSAPTMSDFVMTYPAFFLLNEHDTPEIVDIDDNICLCLFTDVDLLQSFYREKHGKGDEHVQVIAAHSRAELLQILKEWQPIFATDGIRFVGFDVSPWRRPMYGELVGFIAFLEGEDDF